MSELPGNTSEDEVVFFVHVMKTGGTSVKRGLPDGYASGSRFPEPRSDNAIKFKGSTEHFFGMSAERRAATRWVSGHLPLSAALKFREEETRPVSIISLLRDGSERAVSHLRQVARRFDYKYSYRELLNLPLLGDYFFSNHQTRALGIGEPGWEEWDRCFHAMITLESLLEAAERSLSITSVSEVDLQRAVSALSQINVLGLQHDFDNWWQRCSDRYDWPSTPPPPANVGADRESTNAPPIPENILGELRERNELDCRLYAAAQNSLRQ